MPLFDAGKADAEKAAADAKVVILASVTRRLFVCSKSAVCFRELEVPSVLVLHTRKPLCIQYRFRPVLKRLTSLLTLELRV
jgi:hypothetical protein